MLQLQEKLIKLRLKFYLPVFSGAELPVRDKVIKIRGWESNAKKNEPILLINEISMY